MRRTSRILFFFFLYTFIHYSIYIIYTHIFHTRVYVKHTHTFITTGNVLAIGDRCPDVWVSRRHQTLRTTQCVCVRWLRVVHNTFYTCISFFPTAHSSLAAPPPSLYVYYPFWASRRLFRRTHSLATTTHLWRQRCAPTPQSVVRSTSSPQNTPLHTGYLIV